MATKNQTTDAQDTEPGIKEGNRPAQPGKDDQQIVGQTLEQTR